jgi:hypothetical protein
MISFPVFLEKTISAKDVNAQRKDSGAFGGKILCDYLLYVLVAYILHLTDSCPFS